MRPQRLSKRHSNPNAAMPQDSAAVRRRRTRRQCGPASKTVSSSGCESPAAFVAGFCGETEEEHAATVDLMRSTNYDSAFMFAYSQRDKTAAARHLEVRSGRYMLKIPCCSCRPFHLQACAAPGCRPCSRHAAAGLLQTPLSVCKRLLLSKCCPRQSAAAAGGQTSLVRTASFARAAGRCARGGEVGAAARDHCHLPRRPARLHGRRGRPPPPGALFQVPQITLAHEISTPTDDVCPRLAPCPETLF